MSVSAPERSPVDSYFPSDIDFDATRIPVTRSDTANLRVYGMTCGACTSAIENNLTSKPGILDVTVSLPLNSARVGFDRTVVGPRDIVEWVEETGFDVILAGDDDATQIQSLTRAKETREWKRRFLWSIVFGVLFTYGCPSHLSSPPKSWMTHPFLRYSTTLGPLNLPSAFHCAFQS